MFTRLFISILLISILVGCSDKASLKQAEITKLSISSDGKYVISGYDNHYLLLWNIANHSYQVISRHANENSPYFIKHTHYFIWQNKNNKVYVQNILSRVVKKFQLKYSVLDQVMTTDLKTYIAEDKDWKLYKNYGKNEQIIKHYGTGSSKALNLTLSNNNQYLLTSGFAGVQVDKESITKSYNDEKIDHWDRFGGITLWNISTGVPIKKFWGTDVESQTYATLSPQDHYIVGGGVGGGTVLAAVHNNFRTELAWLKNKPKDFKDPTGNNAMDTVESFKYITQKSYLRFTQYIPYAVLYEGTNKNSIKYLPLGQVPYPSVGYLSRDESIDTSPSTHILVTGQEVDDGINVYQYDPKTQTLYRVWTPIINKRSNMPPISKDVPTLPGVKFSDLTKVKQVG